MATATADFIGSTPLSIPDATGGQLVVPLSALEFSGSDLRIKAAWKAAFDNGEQERLLMAAASRAATGELAPPPTPALALAAAHSGPEGNWITVTVLVEKDAPRSSPRSPWRPSRSTCGRVSPTARRRRTRSGWTRRRAPMAILPGRRASSP